MAKKTVYEYCWLKVIDTGKEAATTTPVDFAVWAGTKEAPQAFFADLPTAERAPLTPAPDARNLAVMSDCTPCPATNDATLRERFEPSCPPEPTTVDTTETGWQMESATRYHKMEDKPRFLFEMRPVGGDRKLALAWLDTDAGTTWVEDAASVTLLAHYRIEDVPE